MLRIGITGQNGFVGNHLLNSFGLDTEKYIRIDFKREFFDNEKLLENFVSECDVIVHLAAMNRDKDQQVIYNTNVDLVEKLIVAMEATNSKPHVIFSSSTQEGKDNLYGNSKKKGRELFRAWSIKNKSCFTGLIIPNVFGPFGKPFYNSFISTFCYQLKNGETPKIIKDSKVNLIYVKDLVDYFKLIIDNSKEYNCDINVKPSFSLKVSEILKKLKNILANNGEAKLEKIDHYLKETLDSYELKKDSKRIMILGASGMAGHVIYKYLEENSNHTIKNISFRKKVNEDTILLDVRNFSELEKIISEFAPNVIINAIGILVNDSKENPSNSILLNSYFPHFLSNISKIYNYKIIHLSTDCVFSGNKGNYTEKSFRDADDVYGRSKALGEIDSKDHLTIRTSIVGPEFKSDGQGLLHWFLKQNKAVTGYSNAYWSGITTLQLAKVINDILSDFKFSGIYHVTNNTKISKYNLLLLFKEIWNKPTQVIKGEGKSVDKSFKDTKDIVKIPAYSKMLMELKEFMDFYDKDFNYRKNYKI